MTSIDLFVQYIGTLGTISFMLIACSDFIVKSIDIIVLRLVNDASSDAEKRLLFVWTLVKDLYEEFRGFLDRLSAFSRPREVKKTEEIK